MSKAVTQRAWGKEEADFKPPDLANWKPLLSPETGFSVAEQKPGRKVAASEGQEKSGRASLEETCR